MDQNVSKYQGFDPPEAHLCGGSNNRRQALKGHEAIVEEAVVEEAVVEEAVAEQAVVEEAVVVEGV